MKEGRKDTEWSYNYQGMIISLHHSQKVLFLILIQLFSQPVALTAWRISINSVLTLNLNFLGSNFNVVLSHVPQISSTDSGCHITSQSFLQNRGQLMLLMALHRSAMAVPWQALNENLLRTAVHHLVCFQAQLMQSNQFSGKEPSYPMWVFDGDNS